MLQWSRRYGSNDNVGRRNFVRFFAMVATVAASPSRALSLLFGKEEATALILIPLTIVQSFSMHKARLDMITSSFKRAKQPRHYFLEVRLFEFAELCVITLGFLFLFKDPFE